MVPLGGEKCHGQNELEPFPFPGGNAAVQSARAQQEQGSMGSCPLKVYVHKNSSITVYGLSGQLD